MKFKLLIGIAVCFLAGCKEGPEDLDRKAVERWEAIIESDYDKAYEYFSPGYQKTENAASFAMNMTKAKIRVEWKSVKFINKSCVSDTQCQVVLELLYKYSFPRKSMGEIEIPSTVKENWIFKSGKWYHVPKLNLGNSIQQS